MSDLSGFRELSTLATEMYNFERFHPRAVKLFRKRKNFFVVSEDEPYALDVYNMIRKQEQHQGTWSEDDECAYQEFAKNFTGDITK